MRNRLSFELIILTISCYIRFVIKPNIFNPIFLCFIPEIWHGTALKDACDHNRTLRLHTDHWMDRMIERGFLAGSTCRCLARSCGGVIGIIGGWRGTWRHKSSTCRRRTSFLCKVSHSNLFISTRYRPQILTITNQVTNNKSTTAPSYQSHTKWNRNNLTEVGVIRGLICNSPFLNSNEN